MGKLHFICRSTKRTSILKQKTITENVIEFEMKILHICGVDVYFKRFQY